MPVSSTPIALAPSDPAMLSKVASIPGMWNWPGAGGTHLVRSRSSVTSMLAPLGAMVTVPGASRAPSEPTPTGMPTRPSSHEASPGMNPSAMCCTTNTACSRSAGR